MPRPSPLQTCRRAFPCSPPFIALRKAHPRYVVSIRRAPPCLAQPGCPTLTGCGSFRRPFWGSFDGLTRSELGRTSPFRGEGGKVWNRRFATGGAACAIVRELSKKPPFGYIGSPPLSVRAGSGVVGIEEAIMHTTIPTHVRFAKRPWNKGRLIGQ